MQPLKKQILTFSSFPFYSAEAKLAYELHCQGIPIVDFFSNVSNLTVTSTPSKPSKRKLRLKENHSHGIIRELLLSNALVLYIYKESSSRIFIELQMQKIRENLKEEHGSRSYVLIVVYISVIELRSKMCRECHSSMAV